MSFYFFHLSLMFSSLDRWTTIKIRHFCLFCAIPAISIAAHIFVTMSNFQFLTVFNKIFLLFCFYQQFNIQEKQLCNSFFIYGKIKLTYFKPTSLINTQSKRKRNKQLQINSTHYTFILPCCLLSFPMYFLFFFFLFFFVFSLQCTPCKAEQPVQGMELQEKEAQKD